MDLIEKFISREDIYHGKVLNVVKDKVLLPNGKTSFREVNLHNGAACVVPITNDGKIILVKQFRYAIGKTIYEIPAGKIDPGEDGLTAAKRELAEEVGKTSKNIVDLGIFYGSPAILSEKIYMYLALELENTTVHLDEDEFLDIVEMSFDDVIKLICSNEIEDGKTIAAVLKAKQILNK